MPGTRVGRVTAEKHAHALGIATPKTLLKAEPPDNWALFSPLADPTRWQIFRLLMGGPMSVKVIAAELPISQPAVSQHLKILKNANLVIHQQMGRYRVYGPDPVALDRLSMQFGLLRDHILTERRIASVDGPRQAPRYDAVDEAMEQWLTRWPQHDAHAVGLMLRMRLIAQELERLSGQAAARFDLTTSQVHLLATLDRIPSLCEGTLTELSKYSFMSLPTTTRHVERLNKRGLVGSRPNADDARSTLIHLTRKGRALLHEIFQSQREREHAAVFRMSADNRVELARILRSLLKDLSDTPTS